MTKVAERLKLIVDDMMTEYVLLQAELKELNELYQEVRNEKLKNLNGGSKSSYVFIATQNGTLNSIGSNRVSVISKMSDIRRTMNDLWLKEFTANKSLDLDGMEENETVKKVYDMIMGIDKKSLIGTINSNSTSKDNLEPEEIDDSGDLLDLALDELDKEEEEVPVVLTEVEKESEYNLFQELLEKHHLELYLDVTTLQPVILSTAEADNGSIIEEEYIQKIPDLHKMIYENLETIEVNEEEEYAVTNISKISLIELVG